ncbi:MULTISPECIES: NifB/NifX family molybdenum-iron cluster-binding protein [Edwardsiella]|uniref:Dinitrogenase iron-molybdenum cofactor biosynthesis domain-containing protein n=2 Tax=Edwardsiella anguillarum TaxID=1821960 RepID=A0A076LQ43_9GAMM|nr:MULTISPECIES: NifB/NifX family molybdenum-iron cluster-binding protein [Edwardsiella]AIJ10081.1 Hypothetical protein ETEE_3666 [Edwardsiella anguillarum ET080813]KAB0589725.1 hypothetical protein F7P84_13460 [Edwardsiella anguillarum]UBU95002.1 hypothetical protein AAZ33_19075 [Edwardsiella sp. LADL05-105]UOU80784.1 hypothetical protein MUN71_09605 [Edwardsiella anguillarum]WHP85529.1 hypothetical protein MQ095_09065 [Edwardsiella anguillarum]
MLTAIPMHGNRIAGHLARAPQVAIFDQQGSEIARYDNPAAAEHCAGKKQLLALLRQQRVQRLVVRNVGQHMAQRLLAMGLEIRLVKGGDLQSACCQDPCPLPALTDPAQARPSRKAHDGAHGCGGGCHGHSATPAAPSLLQPRHSQNGAPHIVRCQRI